MASVTLDIILPEPIPPQFDVIEVWRSRVSATGPYEALTSAGNKSARLPVNAPDPPNPIQTGPLINASGKTIKFRLGIFEFEVTATGSNPLTYTQLATQIAAASLGLLRAYVVGGILVFETTKVGGEAALAVIGGDIAGLLGFDANEETYGQQAYIPVLVDALRYSFVDYFGSSKYYYKVRGRNSLTNAVGEFYSPFSPSDSPLALDTVLGFVQLVDMDGRGLGNREVQVYSRFSGQLFNGRVVAGYSKRELTDESGTASFVLVRGLPITVAIAGTDLARDLVVPTDPAIIQFDLLDPSLGSNDVFKVQVPNVAYANRTST